jgi:hypothetical protein
MTADHIRDAAATVAVVAFIVSARFAGLRTAPERGGNRWPWPRWRQCCWPWGGVPHLAASVSRIGVRPGAHWDRLRRRGWIGVRGGRGQRSRWFVPGNSRQCCHGDGTGAVLFAAALCSLATVIG